MGGEKDRRGIGVRRGGGVVVVMMTNSRDGTDDGTGCAHDADDEGDHLLVEEEEEEEEEKKSMTTLEGDLSREIDMALALALDALVLAENNNEYDDEVDDDDATTSSTLDESDIDDIANMLLESRPTSSRSPSPSLSKLPPPPSSTTSLADAFKRRAAEVVDEIERLRSTIFGIESELVLVEASAAREEDASFVIRREIEESLMERKTTIDRMEMEFA
jgi:hypothetical protein